MGLKVCAVTVVGSSFDSDEPYEEPDIQEQAGPDEGNSSEDYEAPELKAEVPDKPVYDAKTGELLDPLAV